MYVRSICIGAVFFALIGCSETKQTASSQEVSQADQTTPTRLTVSPTFKLKTYQEGILVAWDSIPAQEILIRRGLSPDRLEEIASPTAEKYPTRRYLDEQVEKEVTYYYSLAGVSVKGGIGLAGPSSAPIAARIDVTLPDAPQFTLHSLPAEVTVRWRPSKHAFQYWVERRQVSPRGSFRTISTMLPEDTLSFADSTVKKGVRYAYRVWAGNSVGNATADAISITP